MITFYNAPKIIVKPTAQKDALPGEISFVDSALHLWTKDPDTEILATKIMRPLERWLKRRGWSVTADPRVLKDYPSASPNHRLGRRGDLEFDCSCTGRHFSIQFFQNILNVTNRNGGRYDFDKLNRMPYLMRLETINTILAIAQWLHDRHGIRIATPKITHDELKGGLATAAQLVSQSYAECWHTDKSLGRPVCESHSNAKGIDGDHIEHGAVVYFRDRSGRWNRGVAQYNINSMWYVVCNDSTVRNLSCGDLTCRVPADLRIKSAPGRRARLEKELSKAVASMDFERAAKLRDILFGDAKLYRIWSQSKEAWYRPEARGYTADSVHAGLYRQDEIERRRLGSDSDLKLVPVAA